MSLSLKVLMIALAAISLLPQALARQLPDDFRSRLDPDPRMEDPILPDQQAPDAGQTRIAAIEAAGIAISKVNFKGVAVPGRVAASAEPFIGRKLTRNTLESLVAALSDAYGTSDIVLFTIVLPEQDFAGGVVNVHVAEGHIEQVILEGDLTAGETAVVSAHARRLTRDKPTQRSTFDRNILLLGDVPGLTVTPNVLAGQTPGGVKLQLAAEQKRTDFSVGYDSRTTSLIDQGQFNGKAAGYGLLRAGDETRIDLASSTDFENFRYAGLQHSTPLGTNGLRASVGAAWLESLAENTGLSGRATLYSAGLSYPFIRSSKQNLRGALIGDGLNSDNAAFGSLIATERTRALRGRLAYDWSDDGSAALISIEVSQGFDVWDAFTSQPQDELEFLKVEPSVKLVKRFNERYFLRASAEGLWSKDALPANERFSVGGQDFGRAFENGLLSADKGGAALLEAAIRPIKSGKFAKSEFYGFVDYAAVDFNREAASSIDLGSAGLGVRLAYGEVGEIGLEAARPFLEPVPGYGEDWQVNLSWSLSYDPR